MMVKSDTVRCALERKLEGKCMSAYVEQRSSSDNFYDLSSGFNPQAHIGETFNDRSLYEIKLWTYISHHSEKYVVILHSLSNI